MCRFLDLCNCTDPSTVHAESLLDSENLAAVPREGQQQQQEQQQQQQQQQQRQQVQRTECASVSVADIDLTELASDSDADGNEDELSTHSSACEDPLESATGSVRQPIDSNDADPDSSVLGEKSHQQESQSDRPFKRLRSNTRSVDIKPFSPPTASGGARGVSVGTEAPIAAETSRHVAVMSDGDTGSNSHAATSSLGFAADSGTVKGVSGILSEDREAYSANGADPAAACIEDPLPDPLSVGRSTSLATIQYMLDHPAGLTRQELQHLRRINKNRRSAHNFRLRQKAAVIELQGKVAQLEQANSQLVAQISSLSDSIARERQGFSYEKATMQETINGLLRRLAAANGSNSGADESFHGTGTPGSGMPYTPQGFPPPPRSHSNPPSAELAASPVMTSVHGSSGPATVSPSSLPPPPPPPQRQQQQQPPLPPQPGQPEAMLYPPPPGYHRTGDGQLVWYPTPPPPYQGHAMMPSSYYQPQPPMHGYQPFPPQLHQQSQQQQQQPRPSSVQYPFPPPPPVQQQQQHQLQQQVPPASSS